MKETAESMKVEGFWKHYREMKQSDPKSYTVQKVKEYSKKKSDYERASINYPIQAGGSMCLRISMIRFFEYLREHNLLGIVKICVSPYDE